METKDSSYIGTFLLSTVLSAWIVGKSVYQLQKELVENERDDWED